MPVEVARASCSQLWHNFLALGRGETWLSSQVFLSTLCLNKRLSDEKIHSSSAVCDVSSTYYPGQKIRYSLDIHEIDPQCDHLISCDTDFDLQRELATRRGRESRRCRAEARYRTISHDRTVDQPHEFLGCNNFFGQGSTRQD